MEIVEILVDINVYQGLTLKKGHEYVMVGAVRNQLSKIYPGGINVTRNFSDVYRKVDLSVLTNEKEVFLFRSGGIGDVMFMLPLIKELKKKYFPRIKVGTSPMYCSAFGNNPDIDKIVPMPFDVVEMDKSDFHLMFEGVIEDSTRKAHFFHSVDLFLEEGGIDSKTLSSSDKIPRLYLDDDEKLSAVKRMRRDGVLEGSRKIGIQIESSSPIRTFPLDKSIAVMRKLLEENFYVFVFGGKRQQEVGQYLDELFEKESKIINLITKDISLRDSMIYTSAMDVMIAPDSSFIHIAGALGVPIVGLYGCFPSLLRMKYYKNAIGIDCNVACAPSFIHGHSSCDKGFPSPCFSAISVQNILDAVYHFMSSKKISSLYPSYNEFVDGELVKSPFVDEDFFEKRAGSEDGRKE